MDSDQGKLFVGGISFETTEEKLRDYFGNYGDIYQVNIMRDKATGRPRGFGFILFSDPSVLDTIIQDKHTIDGRPVEAKRAMSREDQQNSGKGGNNNGGRNSGGGGNFRTKKIFVGGLPPSLTDEGFRQYFENYGHVTDVVIMFDQNTQRPRGFGFISFDSEDAVDRVLQNTFHDLDGKQVEVKRALPKDANPGMGSRGGGGYNSGGGQNAYDSRMDSNRYMQAQNAGGGFPPYGSSGYGAAGYGYGPANAGMGYGGYAAYGAANPGYGGPANAAYGNPNASAARSSWNAQAASGYGAAGYGNAGPWGASGAGSGGPTGQSPSGTSGYGNQGYGYGNYGGGGDGYGNRAGGGAGNNASGGGGEMQGGYGSGYGDGNGHGGYGAGGYGAQANGAHGSQMGYGGGYSGAQGR